MKPREFWVFNQSAIGGKSIFKMEGSDAIETWIYNYPHVDSARVIEKSAYDQLLEQSNKLAKHLDEWSFGNSDALKDWQEFKKSQGIE